MELALSFIPLKFSNKLINFRTKELYGEHFTKHVKVRREFGPITQAAYLEGARRLYNSVVDGKNIMIKSRIENKATLFYKVDTNEFLSVSYDGYIKTYFKPVNSLKYWEGQ